ncbi:hypothetical protein PVT68_10280 [Microbulbifer bruguierae]|uniref:Xanthine/uracil/vitamin C permease n=1 Tax=Microbulbifer bruguierae TaxID=3029061 RepID=A0ABY8N983_9GAMM|nr:hypothetical protein [Microbulbifer bruguierae]WGL15162.1 hypothetical protein PVT68_10280 [Microbulbifer bruguierae]
MNTTPEKSPGVTGARNGAGGWRWGPFTLCVPFLHLKVVPSQLIQGLVVASGTSMIMAPVLIGYFGLSFEEAVALIMLANTVLCTSFLLFGEPFAPGMLTPAFPLALTFIVSSYPEGPERFQAMTALSICLAGILLFFSLTGLSRRVMASLPAALKAGIIFGAAISALDRVFVKDVALFESHPISATAALLVALLFTFSGPIQRLRAKSPLVDAICSLGLLPGFLAAAFVGLAVGEVQFTIQWGWLLPPVPEMFAKVSPLSIGWPPAAMYLDVLPLAFVAYVIVFGDFITGSEMIRSAQPMRSDNPIDLDFERTQVAVAARNGVSAVIAPLFPFQGVLWTGVHAVIVQAWGSGRDKVANLRSGIGSYYVFGLPFIYLCWPWISLIKPLMSIALMLTLALTAFACILVAVPLVKKPLEMVCALVTGYMLAMFDVWTALGAAVFLLVCINGSLPQWNKKAQGRDKTEMAASGEVPD